MKTRAAKPQSGMETPMLSSQAVEAYRQDGYYFPIDVMSTARARECRDRLEAFERGHGGPLKGELRHKPHLLFTWLNDLIRDARILDAVEDVLGPNLLCWGSSFFIKEANDAGFVSWHQDSTYWGLSTPDVVTAWVAFTEATEANGAMEYIPGSHKLDQIPHRDTFAKHISWRAARPRMRQSRPTIPGGGSSPCVPARCHCTTCASSTARRPTRRTTGASASPSAISRRA
jgi:hypothetical protein